MGLTRLISNYSLKPDIIVYILSGIILGRLIVDLPYAAIFFTIALIVLFLFLESPLKALSILVFITPFSGTILLRGNLINLPGAKPLMFLALFVVIIAIINHWQSVKMPKYSFIFAILLLSIFSISIIRSLSNLDIINYYIINQGGIKLSTSKYILTEFVKQLIYFLPFIIIIKFVKKISHLEYLMNILALSLAILSICILLNKFYIPLDLGKHRNALATFYIVGFPIVFGRYFIKKNIINILSICLIVTAIGFLYCRTAYLTLIVSSIFYLSISKRAKFLPVLIVISIGLSFIISSSIIERASKGLESGDRVEISAGRTDRSWLPLIVEYVKSPKKLLLGNGRFAILSSDAVASGITPNTYKHPHNMYLEQILDAGIFGLIAIMLFFIVLFKKIYKNLSYIQDFKLKEYQYAVIASLISYFLAGITGRSLFPDSKGAFFWIIVGIAVVIIRMVQESGENINAKT